MPRTRLLVAATLLAVALPRTVAAQTFSGGLPALWRCTGTCGTSAADGDVALAPNAGTRYGFVSTAGSKVTGLGLPGIGAAKDVANGSVLRSGVFSAGSGDVLAYWFNYVSRDGAGFADYAWSRLLTASGAEVALLFTARTSPDGSAVPGPGMPAAQATLTPGTVSMTQRAPVWGALGADEGDPAWTEGYNCFAEGCGFTGWVRSTYTIAGAGEYMLEFGVVNWGDTLYQSGLAFDGIRVNGQTLVASRAGPAATAQSMLASAPAGTGVIAAPEPAPFVLVATGILALAVVQRRRRPT